MPTTDPVTNPVAALQKRAEEIRAEAYACWVNAPVGSDVLDLRLVRDLADVLSSVIEQVARLVAAFKELARQEEQQPEPRKRAEEAETEIMALRAELADAKMCELRYLAAIARLHRRRGNNG